MCAMIVERSLNTQFDKIETPYYYYYLVKILVLFVEFMWENKIICFLIKKFVVCNSKQSSQSVSYWYKKYKPDTFYVNEFGNN